MQIFNFETYQVQVTDEPTYSIRSADNHRKFQRETRLDSVGYQHSSAHGICVTSNGNVVSSHVVASSGGATTVHEKSAAVLADKCVLAIGPYLIAFHLPTLDIVWSVEADPATVFGIHLSNDQSFFLVHGELSVSRISLDGEIQWQAGGADIFTEGFSVHDAYIQAIDFDNRTYRFDIQTGCDYAGA